MTGSSHLQSPSREDISQMMDSIYLPEWRVVSQTFIINDIKQFAIDMKSFAAENSLDDVTAWSDMILTSCAEFDILQITDALAAFPTLMQDISGRTEEL